MTSTDRPITSSPDIIRRVQRSLPCKLTTDELLQVALQRTDAEALRDQHVEDFDKLKQKHKGVVEEIDDKILKWRRELHSKHQDRTVQCLETFERNENGTGHVVTIRTDTGEVVESRPATPVEVQRYLPGVDAPHASAALLDQAAAAQGVPEDLDEDDEEDDGTEQTPAQKSAAESRKARKARKKS